LVAFLVGGGGCGFGRVLFVKRLLHHQKPAAPSNARAMAPTIAARIAQRIASFAITKTMASKITPAIIEMVVKDISIHRPMSKVQSQRLRFQKLPGCQLC
jgi:hypothetical protein